MTQDDEKRKPPLIEAIERELEKIRKRLAEVEKAVEILKRG